MDDNENLLLWYLVEVDTPNYELIDDEDEKVDAMVTAMDAHSSYHCALQPKRRFQCVDGEAIIIRHDHVYLICFRM
jgi:hypothetical protein